MQLNSQLFLIIYNFTNNTPRLNIKQPLSANIYNKQCFFLNKNAQTMSTTATPAYQAT